MRAVGRLEANVEISVDAGPQAIPHLLVDPRLRLDPGGGLHLQRDDDRVEQRLLVIEVVIERAARDPRVA